MSVTYTRVEGAAAVAALPVGTLVAEVLDSHRAKRFLPVNAPPGGTAASMVFPAIAEVGQVADHAGNAVGPVNLRLRAAMGDLVNVMSPLSYVCDQAVCVVTARGTF